MAATKQRARQTLALLSQHADRFPDTVSEQAHGLLAERSRLSRRLGTFSVFSPTVTKIRCHGNYHLGQVLRPESDFVILDFAGDSVRPLAERRAKQSPLKDVAGMIRSFDYASQTGLLAAARNGPADRPRLEPWETDGSAGPRPHL